MIRSITCFALGTLLLAVPASAWTPEWRGTEAESFAIGASGDLFAVTTLTLNSSVYDLARIEGDSGDVEWKRRVRLDGRSTAVGDIALDASEAIFLVSSLRDGDEFALTVTRHEPERGRPVWLHDIATGTISDARAIAVDAAGDVVAAGSTGEPVVPTGFHTSFVVAKLAGATGTELWQRDLEGTTTGQAHNLASALAVTSSGDVVAGGNLQNDATGRDFAVVKLAAADGADVWRTEIDGVASSDDSLQALAVDGAGDVLIAGQSFTPTDSKFVVIKLSGTTGVELWRAFVTGGSSIRPERATAVAADSNGDVIAGGTLQNDGRDDFAVVKLAGGTGAELWRFIATESCCGNLETAFSVAIDSSDDVIAAGSLSDGPQRTYAARISGATGSLVWHRLGVWDRFYVQRTEVLLDGDENPIVAGQVKLARLTGDDIIGGSQLRILDPGGNPDARSLLFDSRIGIDRPLQNPVSGGAVLEIHNPSTGESASFSLPAALWSEFGGFAAKAFQYSDPDRTAGPCTELRITDSRLTAKCSGSQLAFSLDEPSQGGIAVRLTTVDGTGFEHRYCALFGGTIVRDEGTDAGSGIFLAKRAPAPTTCLFP
jgi:outer membrane protein assembly factor BamB